MSGLREILLHADDTYLTALTNKGLVKRAERELESSGVTFEFRDEVLSGMFSDGTSVYIKEPIQDFVCSCPSRTVCKHVLMTMMAARKELSGASEDEVGEYDFSMVYQMSAEELQSFSGKTKYRTAVFSVLSGEQATVKEDSVLTVILEEQFTVVFLPNASVKQSTCSCKASGYCIHRTKAVLYAMIVHFGELKPEFVLEDEEPKLAYSTTVLPYVQEYMMGIMSKGLARLPYDTPERLEQIAVICHGSRLADLERLCRLASGRLKRYREKSVGFVEEAFITDLCTILYLCQNTPEYSDQSVQYEQKQKIVGVFRQQYHPVAELTLLGLGAYGWYSDGGFVGVTTLFYEQSRKEVCQFTVTMPNTGKNTPDDLIKGEAPWGLSGKLSVVIHADIRLKKGKLNAKNQLSSSSETKAYVIKETEISRVELDGIWYEDCKGLLDHTWSCMEDKGEYLMAIFLPDRWGETTIDHIQQKVYLPLYDHEGRCLKLMMQGDEMGKRMLHSMDELNCKELLYGAVLARFFIRDGELIGVPVTVYSDKAYDLSLEKFDTKKRKSR